MSLDKRLRETLPFVKKPIRYVNHEMYCIVKPSARVSVAFVFPDVYEIGMSNHGLRILYHIVNKIENAKAERVYIPWIDMIEQMKKRDIPLFSLESKTPLSRFDIIGFSLQSELSYTNVLLALSLADIPLFSDKRSKKHPVVIAGGPCTVNPLPLKEFIDAFVIGEGEEVMREIIDVFKKEKDREKRIEALSEIEGVWVPLLHKKEKQIKKRWVKELKYEDFPMPPLLPFSQIEHDRLTIEIARGCTRGCRFCQAGYITRPVRERPEEDIIRIAHEGIGCTGWEEVSLLSFSVSDYSAFKNTLSKLVEVLYPKKIALSIPSFRGETVDDEMIRLLSLVKKTGLTMAPETVSQKLKKRINKFIKEEEIFKAISIAEKFGWRHVKLYFMIGLPGETWEDVEEIIRFLKETSRVFKRMSIKAHVSPFVPKPHTAFQWERFEPIESLKEKIEKIKSDTKKVRNISIKWANPEASLIEAILARGDEKLNKVIKNVFDMGGIFQEWSEFFRMESWIKAFEKEGIEYRNYTDAKTASEKLPWEFIFAGVDKEFLLREKEKAEKGELTEDCRIGTCSRCGACSPEEINKYRKKRERKSPLVIIPQKTEKKTTVEKGFRIKFGIEEPLRYASHLDIVRMVYRMLRRSSIPIVYTEGFSPHPKVSFGLPKPVGVTSRGEYLDIRVKPFYHGNIVKDLEKVAPPGFRIYTSKLFYPPKESITKIIDVAHYEVLCEELTEEMLERAKNSSDVLSAYMKDSTLTLFLKVKEGVKLYNVLSTILGNEEKALSASVERIDLYANYNGKLTTPLEVI